jgi:hypothetical protein
MKTKTKKSVETAKMLLIFFGIVGLIASIWFFHIGLGWKVLVTSILVLAWGTSIKIYQDEKKK